MKDSGTREIDLPQERIEYRDCPRCCFTSAGIKMYKVQFCMSCHGKQRIQLPPFKLEELELA